MGPELHLQMITYRTAELHKEADGYRLALKAEEGRQDHQDGRRRWGLLGKIIPA